MDPVHRERDGLVRIASPQEIPVQRVHGTDRINRVGRSNERLSHHLAAIDASVRHVLARCSKDILTVVAGLNGQAQRGEESLSIGVG